MTTPELVAAVKKNPISVGCGVLSLALLVAVYIRFDAISDANTRLDQKTAQARRLSLNIANGTQLKDHLDAALAANKEIDTRLIRSRDIGINQQYFFKLESETGVRLTELRQGTQVARKAGFTAVPFDIGFEGDFTQVLRFLRALETGPHYCRVIAASTAVGREAPLTVSITLELLGRQ